MNIEEMTKVELITAIIEYEERYGHIKGRLFAKDVATLRAMLYKLAKKINVVDELLCVSCGLQDIYQEDEIDKDIFGLYVKCHRCGTRVRIPIKLKEKQDERVQVHL